MSDSHKHNWGYNNEHNIVGPNEWSKYYKVGRHQSPINITVCDCLLSSVYDSNDSKNRCNSDKEPVQDLHTCCLSSIQLSSLSNSLETKVRLDAYDDSKKSSQHHKRHHLSTHPNDNNDSDDRRRSPSSSSRSSIDSTAQQLQFNNEDKSSCYLNQRTRYCFTNKKIFIGYPRYISAVPLCNTGHSWQVNIPSDLSAHTLIAGPPFGDREYRLAQLHCHWGQDNEQGSEHTINGRGYSAEIHFVHWNCSQYESMEEASRHKHGLAVLGVFVQALGGEQNRNKYLDKIIAGLNQVRAPDSKITLYPRLDLKKILPANRSLYASYEGSLTTPPLSEVVDWVVFLQPIQCSSSQIKEFSQIKCQAGGNLDKNCRPVQPHNDRVISLWIPKTSKY